jgi:hypothetical protein
LETCALSAGAGGAFLSKIEQVLHDPDDLALRHDGAGGAGQQSLIPRPILDRLNWLMSVSNRQIVALP